MAWWEQAIYGRQPMNEFCSRFDDGDVSGGGVDVVGRFTVRGDYDDRGTIRLIKQYVGKHVVCYEGRQDGEGTIVGQWSIPPLWSGPFALRPVVSPDTPILVIE
ncbi:MAG: hypothetical protein U0746_21305 [Gemmataceae bacterium]